MPFESLKLLQMATQTASATGKYCKINNLVPREIRGKLYVFNDVSTDGVGYKMHRELERCASSAQ